jgi:hypothetical protein
MTAPTPETWTRGDACYYWRRSKGCPPQKISGTVVDIDQTGTLARVRNDAPHMVPVQVIEVSRLRREVLS